MFLTPQRKLSKTCPSCGKNFKENKGPSCLASCAEQQLAEKHQQILSKMLSCLLRQKIVVECPFGLSAKFAKSQGWGWTNDIAKIITIPWWTLRSKKEFFDTVAHEAGHIIAYQKICLSCTKNSPKVV
ncbi:MAG: hypothetical protein MRECE_12c033 [Mycoplasmataceae bacterium CE_OT135]|nr:MAG: hypothetical protein MRECE_12c033 [Mycoplasmataceae bacterium CE_OT135]